MLIFSIVPANQPEVLVIQCGLDGLAGDPMSIWNLDCRSVLKVISTFLSWDLPTLLLGGGGYDNVNAAKCWSLITSLALGRLEMSDLEEEQDRDEASLGSGNSLVKARGNEADDKEFARENGRHTETEPTLSEEGEGMKVDLVEIADKGLDALEEGVEMQVAAVESKGLDRNADGSKAKGGQGRLDKISLSTPVPFHEFWDRYSRDPILDVRRGEFETPISPLPLTLESIFQCISDPNQWTLCHSHPSPTLPILLGERRDEGYQR
ncbi:hypothetical protein IE53DRAFT_182771 [Violaceomyces palustris]|uniref:Uncharacterized protein n=1 Tax=Violaceomyces palustris TaxID=1673888 RepID=A0ACD0NSB1_9BASI|nr:hypothetical protein IE53DRAFT_182771 [Violaceomyces palustris]